MNLLTPAALERQDSWGVVTLQAMAPAPFDTPEPSFSNPGAYICSDSKTYWLKSTAQHGLSAELIAGRLAASTGTGPAAQVIWLPSEVARPDEGRLAGMVVGSEDVPGTVNARYLNRIFNNTELSAKIDSSTRARVIAFQTWIGAQDSQVLVSVNNGHIFSFDHGDCFGNVTHPADKPVVSITDIPGVSQDIGREAEYVRPAISRIESVTDEDILKAVSRMPATETWNSDERRRLAIGRWLAGRRPMVRGVLEQWMK